MSASSDSSGESSGSLGASASADSSSSLSASGASQSLSQASRSSSRVGKLLDGRYQLERLLGEGGMGTVYRAHHLAMDRAVAVKVLRGNLARDAIAARRFALEAKATTKVDSPYAVKVFDFGISTDGEYFMVMEYLDGRTAQRELEVDGPMTLRRALHVARQALAGLAAAHAVGVVHRDIKPENLLLMRQGDDPDFCKVLDFGVAKLMVQAAEPSTALTREGMVFGTPEFMSPEQACGQALDGRSDLYSLAATLFTLLTGEPLFRGDSAIAVLSRHVTAPPPRLTERRGLHHLHALDQVLQRALAKRPADRHRDAEELGRELAFLMPASEPTSLAATPTVSTPALSASPLGVLASSAPLADGEAEAEAGLTGDGGDESPAQLPLGTADTGAYAAGISPHFAGGSAHHPATGAAPLVALPTGFRPAMTGYLPRVSLELELEPALDPAARRSRRGLRAVLGVAASGAAVAAALLWSSGLKDEQPATDPPAGQLAAAEPSAPPGTPTDVAPILATPVTAPATTPTGAEPAKPDDAAKPDAIPDDAVKPSPGIDRAALAAAAEAKKRKLLEHLAEAKAAHAAGNNLRQFTQAELAVRLSPRHPEALYLLGDAQLTAGDLVNGCKTLARLRTPRAQARAAKASCP